MNGNQILPCSVTTTIEFVLLGTRVIPPWQLVPAHFSGTKHGTHMSVYVN